MKGLQGKKHDLLATLKHYVGPTADDPLALLSGYSFPVHLIISDMLEQTSQVVTPLEALREQLGFDNVSYTKGCHIIEKRMAGAPVFPGDSSGKPVDSSEVVQLYVHDKVASRVRPVQELKAFKRVHLEPGEFEIRIGASSGEIKSTVVVRVTGETRVIAGKWRMESHCEVQYLNL